MKSKILLFVLIFLLSGCAGEQVPVVLETLDIDTGEVTETIAGHTSESSVEKERQVHKTLRHRDTQTRIAHNNSGLYLKFKLEKIVIKGVEVYLQVTESVTYRERAVFDQELPTEPSVHPVWATAEKLGTALVNAVLIGYGINQVTNMVTSVSAAGTIYHGDFNATNSLNNAGTTQAFDYSYSPLLQGN